MRYVAATVCLIILAGCGSPVPVVPTASSGQPLSSQRPAQSQGAEPSPGAEPSAGASPTGAPSGDPLPQDIVSAIDAIVGAGSLEESIAATRTVLERSGVAVTEDPTTSAKALAGLYLNSQQVATMAHEARSRAGLSQVTFAQFAETFGGLALLPPNDTLLDRLSQPVASPDPNLENPTTVDMNGQALRLAEIVTAWVNRSLATYPSDDQTMTALTLPALYVAELASRQGNPVDLRETFLPADLELGALDVTLLVAGLRSALTVAAQASGLRSGPAEAAIGSWDVGRVGALAVEPTACGELKRIIDGQVPLVTDTFSFGGGEAIKAFAESTVSDIFKNATSLAKGISPAFEALGVLFRVQAMWLLYHSTELTLEIQPATIHKPIGQNEPAAAMFVAGIPDAEWEKARQDRDSSPAATNLKACARLLGIPVTTDLIDVGEATASWRVSWDITRGDAHAQFEGCQFIPSCDRNAVAAGRLERALQKRNDHSGQDTVILEIKPEEPTDHPGREVTGPVRVCAHLRTDKPPDVGTILNAGSAGVSGVTVGGIASLAASVSNILLSWWQFVFTLDKCAETTVSFHVPQPGNWRGTVTINYEHQESRTVTSAGFQGRYRSSTDITDTMYVRGEDHGQLPEGQSQLYISLDTRQYTQGGHVREDVTRRLVFNASGCNYIEDKTFEMSGSWSYNGDSQMSITIEPTGHYRLSVHRIWPDEEVTLPSVDTESFTDNGSIYECEGFETKVREGDLEVTETDRATLLLEGELDLTTGQWRLKGRVTGSELGTITTIEWDLTREVEPVPSP